MNDDEFSTRMALMEDRLKRLQMDHDAGRSEIFSLLREFKNETHKELSELKVDMRIMSDMAARWKGAFLVLTAAGGIIGWALSMWGKIKWQ
jgi:UDP-N-acetylglucosamine:LPS N-acetylglucosamine transferase